MIIFLELIYKQLVIDVCYIMEHGDAIAHSFDFSSVTLALQS